MFTSQEQPHIRIGAVVPAVVIAGLLLLASAVAPARAAWHIGLQSSVPAKDAHLMTAPTEIRLTFTGPVDVKKASVQVSGPGNQMLALDSLRAVADSPRVAVARIAGKMAGGNYRVKWTAIAADGAEGEGTFGFMYMARQ